MNSYHFSNHFIKEHFVWDWLKCTVICRFMYTNHTNQSHAYESFKWIRNHFLLPIFKKRWSGEEKIRCSFHMIIDGWSLIVHIFSWAHVLRMIPLLDLMHSFFFIGRWSSSLYTESKEHTVNISFFFAFFNFYSLSSLLRPKSCGCVFIVIKMNCIYLVSSIHYERLIIITSV